jgi:hypothetical protein
LDEFEHEIKPFVDFGLFFFTVCNAGVAVEGLGAMTLVILISLVVGKFVGIVFCYKMAVTMGFKPPIGVTPSHIYVVGVIAGLGLTVALFVADVAFEDDKLKGDAKLGSVLSIVSGGLAVLLAKFIGVQRKQETGAHETMKNHGKKLLVKQQSQHNMFQNLHFPHRISLLQNFHMPHFHFHAARNADGSSLSADLAQRHSSGSEDGQRSRWSWTGHSPSQQPQRQKKSSFSFFRSSFSSDSGDKVVPTPARSDSIDSPAPGRGNDSSSQYSSLTALVEEPGSPSPSLHTRRLRPVVPTPSPSTIAQELRLSAVESPEGAFRTINAAMEQRSGSEVR